MSTQRNSTISSKPAIDPALQWIGGGALETPTPTTDEPVSKNTSQHVNKLISQQADSGAIQETTAMLSARVSSHLIRKLRIRAATEGRPIQELVADMLRGYLDSK